MKYKINPSLLLGLFLCISICTATKSQTTASTGTPERRRLIDMLHLTSDFNSALKIEPYIGTSASFAYGDFIDYQKSFHNVAEAGTVSKGAIQPIIMVTVGAQLRIMPFNEGVLEKLGLSVGVQYLQKGFANRFNMEHTANSEYKDKMNYKEIYKHNYWAIPLEFRWGRSWFATVGASFGHHIKSTKTQRLKHSQSGAGALDGGFETSATDKKLITKSAIDKTQADFIIGGGYNLTDQLTMAARIALGSNILHNSDDNFRTIVFQLYFSKSFQFIKQ